MLRTRSKLGMALRQPNRAAHHHPNNELKRQGEHRSATEPQADGRELQAVSGRYVVRGSPRMGLGTSGGDPGSIVQSSRRRAGLVLGFRLKFAFREVKSARQARIQLSFCKNSRKNLAISGPAKLGIWWVSRVQGTERREHPTCTRCRLCKL